MKPHIEYFLEHEFKMNPPLDTVSPTARAMWSILLDAIQKWENYRVMFGSESEE